MALAKIKIKRPRPNTTVKEINLYKVLPSNLEIATVLGNKATLKINKGKINVRGFCYFNLAIFLNMIKENLEVIVK